MVRKSDSTLFLSETTTGGLTGRPSSSIAGGDIAEVASQDPGGSTSSPTLITWSASSWA